MTDIERSRAILGLWGEIEKKQREIESYYLKIGKLKDEILLLKQDIIEVQDDVDSSKTVPWSPQGEMS